MLLPGYNGRNRTFWSFNYEGRREMSESVATGWFPSSAMRSGDFSQLLNPVDASGALVRQPIIIYDPQTGIPFPGNVIPANRINAGTKNLLPYFPAQQFQQRDPLDFTNRDALPSQWDRTPGSFAAITTSAARTGHLCASHGTRKRGTTRQSIPTSA